MSIIIGNYRLMGMRVTKELSGSDSSYMENDTTKLVRLIR